MNRKPLALAALLLSLSNGFMGCGSPVRYSDPNAMQALSTDFASSDLQQIATAMVDSLLTFPPVVEVVAKRRPVLALGGVQNRTRQHIDTIGITESIRSRMIRSGKFRFIDRSTDQETIREIRTQQESGLNDTSKAVKFGKQLGAEYMLFGSIMDIPQVSGRSKDVYYKFSLSLKNLTTGILEWTDEKEIRKQSERPLIGW